MPIHDLALAAGAISAAILLSALSLGLIAPDLRVWPSPPTKSTASRLYWTLFRLLNVVVIGHCLYGALENWADGGARGLQAIALAVAAALGVVYAASLWWLGHKATYCRTSGLETRGLYGVSRNPQYATAIAACACLGAASLDFADGAIALALIAVYALMAFSEERWLEANYGQGYRSYKQQVARFFGFRRAATMFADAVIGLRLGSGSGGTPDASAETIRPPRGR